MAVKIIMRLMKSLIANKIKLDEGTRKKVSDFDIVYLEDLGIN